MNIIKFNLKAWVAAIVAPITAAIMITLDTGLGLEVTGLDSFVNAGVTSGLTAAAVWFARND